MMATDMRIQEFKSALLGTGRNVTTIRVFVENDGRPLPIAEELAILTKTVERVANRMGYDPNEVTIGRIPTFTDAIEVEGPGELLWELIKQNEIGGAQRSGGPEAYLA